MWQTPGHGIDVLSTPKYPFFDSSNTSKQEFWDTLYDNMIIKTKKLSIVNLRILDKCCVAGAGAGIANNVTGSSSETVLCSLCDINCCYITILYMQKLLHYLLVYLCHFTIQFFRIIKIMFKSHRGFKRHAATVATANKNIRIINISQYTFDNLSFFL